MRSNQYAIKRYLLSTVSSILKEDKQKTSHKKIIINKRDFFIICLSLKHAFKDILMKHLSHSIAKFISSRQDNMKYKIKIENFDKQYQEITNKSTFLWDLLFNKTVAIVLGCFRCNKVCLNCIERFSKFAKTRSKPSVTSVHI